MVLSLTSNHDPSHASDSRKYSLDSCVAICGACGTTVKYNTGYRPQETSPSLFIWICTFIVPHMFSVIHLMGLCLVPHLQWVISYYPSQDDMPSIMPLQISSFINSFARSPQNHKSQPAVQCRTIAFKSCQSDVSPASYSRHPSRHSNILSGQISHHQFFQERWAGSSYSIYTPRYRNWKLETCQILVDSPLSAQHFAQSADQVGRWVPARIILCLLPSMVVHQCRYMSIT